MLLPKTPRSRKKTAKEPATPFERFVAAILAVPKGEIDSPPSRPERVARDKKP